MFGVRMKVALLVVLLGVLETSGAVTKKSSEQSTIKSTTKTKSNKKLSHSTPKTTTPLATASSSPPPAILAIEIVDSKNATSDGKNIKRTIESSLGYGYQSQKQFGHEPPRKFMIYKYSQHDIPPWKGTQNIGFQHGDSGGEYQHDSIRGSVQHTVRGGSGHNIGGQHHQAFTPEGGYHQPDHSGGGFHPGPSISPLSIQKSITYNLGTIVTKEQPHVHAVPPQPQGYQQEYYQPEQQYSQGAPAHFNPDSTVFTTVNQQGQIGGLSSHIPYQNLDGNGMVPVIILRVYSNQLEDQNGPLHTNLPQSHPYSHLNDINIQPILHNYVQQYIHPGQQQQSHQEHQGGQFAGPQQYNHLPTTENFPSNDHTRVVFHGPQGHIPQGPTAPEEQYEAPQVQHSPQPGYSSVHFHTPHMHYEYNNQEEAGAEQGYRFAYPNELSAEGYYQQEQYAAPDMPQQSQQPQVYEDEAEATVDTQMNVQQQDHNVAYNYHAHPSAAGGNKAKRSKKRNSNRKVDKAESRNKRE